MEAASTEEMIAVALDAVLEGDESCLNWALVMLDVTLWRPCLFNAFGVLSGLHHSSHSKAPNGIWMSLSASGPVNRAVSGSTSNEHSKLWSKSKSMGFRWY